MIQLQKYNGVAWFNYDVADVEVGDIFRISPGDYIENIATRIGDGIIACDRFSGAGSCGYASNGIGYHHSHMGGNAESPGEICSYCHKKVGQVVVFAKGACRCNGKYVTAIKTVITKARFQGHPGPQELPVPEGHPVYKNDTWEDLFDGDDKEGAHGAGKGVVDAPQAVRQEGLLEAAEEGGQGELEARAARVMDAMHDKGLPLTCHEIDFVRRIVLREVQGAYLDGMEEVGQITGTAKLIDRATGKETDLGPVYGVPKIEVVREP